MDIAEPSTLEGTSDGESDCALATGGDSVNVPVITAGGIAYARGVAAALILGASAVQIGTGFLRSPEAMIHPAYADRLAQTEAHETMVTSTFTGRPDVAWQQHTFAHRRPRVCLHQLRISSARINARNAGRCATAGRRHRMQLWAGQAARLARAEPAGSIALQLWKDASGSSCN